MWTTGASASSSPSWRWGSWCPGRTLIGVSWFVFTAFGILGLWLYLRGRIVPAAFALAAYSVSGLIGFGHYFVAGATHMVWWRQAHVVADIVCGLLIAGYAVWMVRRRS